MINAQNNIACSEQVEQAANLLKSADRVLILSHMSPDGDTIGSAFALCRALLKLGKKARVECSDTLPHKYAYLFSDVTQEEFAPDLVVTVDVASENLLGDKLIVFKNSVGLCIDHHPSNGKFAKFTLLNAKAAATCEIIYEVLVKLNVEIDNNIAECIYTGLATDTGCFRYSNTTPQTLRLAALMIEKGADSARINKRLFETTSKQRLMAENLVLGTLEYYFEGKAAVIYVTREICKKCGISEADIEGIPAVPAQIEGVLVGVTIKEKDAGIYKVSLRTNCGVNASEICAAFGGGGHASAAGCSFEGSIEQIRNMILPVIEKAIYEK